MAYRTVGKALLVGVACAYLFVSGLVVMTGLWRAYQDQFPGFVADIVKHGK